MKLKLINPYLKYARIKKTKYYTMLHCRYRIGDIQFNYLYAHIPLVSLPILVRIRTYNNEPHCFTIFKGIVNFKYKGVPLIALGTNIVDECVNGMLGAYIVETAEFSIESKYLEDMFRVVEFAFVCAAKGSAIFDGKFMALWIANCAVTCQHPYKVVGYENDINDKKRLTEYSNMVG